VAYYRAMAAQALHLAQSANDEVQKSSYLDIAAQWNTLAAEAQRRIERQAKTPEPREQAGDPQRDSDRH
jgi:hypothetical protein